MVTDYYTYNTTIILNNTVCNKSKSKCTSDYCLCVTNFKIVFYVPKNIKCWVEYNIVKKHQIIIKLVVMNFHWLIFRDVCIYLFIFLTISRPNNNLYLIYFCLFIYRQGDTVFIVFMMIDQNWKYNKNRL